MPAVNVSSHCAFSHYPSGYKELCFNLQTATTSIYTCLPQVLSSLLILLS